VNRMESDGRAASRDESSHRAVGVTVVTGFLGAGKSTLISRMLREEHGLKIAVVENEFGDQVGIEDAIVTAGVDGKLVDAFVELPNGCLCCTVKDDLVDALSRLVSDPRTKNKFDHIVIECSGLADPAPVAALFWVDDALEMGLRLDGVVTVVDAQLIRNPSRYAEKTKRAEFSKQIALADVVLVNKMDLIEPSSANTSETELLARIRSVNSSAQVHFCAKCRVDLEKLLQLRSFEFDELVLSESQTTCLQAAHDSSHFLYGAVGTASIVFDEEVRFSEQSFTRALGELLWTDVDAEDSTESAQIEEDPGAHETKRKLENVQQIWRVKGLVYMAGEDKTRWLLQGVDTSFEIQPLGAWPQSERKETRIVCIGQHLDAGKIRTCFLSHNTST